MNHNNEKLIKQMNFDVENNDFEAVKQYAKNKEKKELLSQSIFSVNNSNIILSHQYLSLLHVAAFYDNFEVFYILHQLGLPLNKESADSSHPIQYACISNSLEIVSYILQNAPEEATFSYPETVLFI